MKVYKTKEGYVNINKSEKNFELLISKIVSEFENNVNTDYVENLGNYFITVKYTNNSDIELRIGLTDIFEDIGDKYHSEFIKFLTQTLELKNCEEILDLDYLNLRKVAL